MKHLKCRKGFTLIELLIVLAIIGIVAAIFLGGAGGGVGVYGYMMKKDVSGSIESVTSAMPAGSIVSPSAGNTIYQASVVIKKTDGSYVTFSTEDRQWAAFEGEKAKGKCVSARIYPYAPWNFSKGGTFHGGRLISVSDCQ